LKTILITGIGGPTPRSIAKTIRRDNSDYHIIGVDSNPKALGFFMPALVDKHYIVPRATDVSYWPFINDLIVNEKIDLAFVQPEVEVIEWGNYFNIHGNFPCKVLIPPVELASVLMDKSKMAEILEGTEYIPKTIKISQSDPQFSSVENYIKYPCWIRAIQGSGGLGSLKIENNDNLKSWILINRDINEFTVSEYLPGRHLATQMLYYNGKYIKGASLECVEYVMANIAPSKVTGNTSFGRFINESRILTFCNNCVEYISKKLKIKAHGVLSFDLKEDSFKNLKVTEVNIRHMAYTGVMAQAGFNLINDTILILTADNKSNLIQKPYFRFEQPYIFLRDVDTEPVLLKSEEMFLNDYMQQKIQLKK
jgi:carbamoylphosphate synthase large subunit